MLVPALVPKPRSCGTRIARRSIAGMTHISVLCLVEAGSTIRYVSTVDAGSTILHVFDFVTSTGKWSRLVRGKGPGVAPALVVIPLERLGALVAPYPSSVPHIA
eukprot:2847259-Rhodomonas_salina.1